MMNTLTRFDKSGIEREYPYSPWKEDVEFVVSYAGGEKRFAVSLNADDDAKDLADVEYYENVFLANKGEGFPQCKGVSMYVRGEEVERDHFGRHEIDLAIEHIASIALCLWRDYVVRTIKDGATSR